MSPPSGRQGGAKRGSGRKPLDRGAARTTFTMPGETMRLRAQLALDAAVNVDDVVKALGVLFDLATSDATPPNVRRMAADSYLRHVAGAPAAAPAQVGDETPDGAALARRAREQLPEGYGVVGDADDGTAGAYPDAGDEAQAPSA